MNKELLKENIIALLGLESLPDKEKAEMLEKMSELVQRRVMLRVMDLLSDEDAAKMADMEQGDPQAALDFTAEKVPNLVELFKEEAVKLKKEAMEAAAQAV